MKEDCYARKKAKFYKFLLISRKENARSSYFLAFYYNSGVCVGWWEKQNLFDMNKFFQS